MSKRELSKLTGTADVEGSRRKRRRETATLPGSSSDIDVTVSEAGEDNIFENGGSRHGEGGTLKELGSHLLRTVKEAKAKDGRQLALVFQTKPSRKMYPDYYQIIKNPIALDDIKKRLDTGAYSSLQTIRTDFELLFNNALEYNMKDSVIWKDAKDMHKLVQRTYDKLAPLVGADNESDDDDEKGKSKVPNLNRIIKSRLQKLIEKTDKDGRVMSAEFMHLPNKKQWAIYYKQIKTPQCIENIFRKIKRKDYRTSAAFASDVELVFSNAMAFNQVHSGIWEDALALRDYFRQLMSDLPPPHNLPEYSSSSLVSNKIRIKPPVGSTTVTQINSTLKQETSSSTLLLRVPAASVAASKTTQPIIVPTQMKSKPIPSTTPTSSAKTSTSANSATPLVAPQLQKPSPLAPATQPAKSATPQPPASGQQATLRHYQSTSLAAASSSTAATPANKTVSAASKSPVPVFTHPNHQIKSVKMRIQPQGRSFWLDRREGVRTWTMRLVPGETGLNVDDLVFSGDDEGEESSEGDDEEELKQEEEDEDDSTSSPKNGKTRNVKVAVRRSQRTAAVPTRTTRSTIAKNKIQAKKKEIEKVEEVLLKLNGVVVKEKEDVARHWNIGIPAGSNVLEVGEKGGLMWKVYIERVVSS